MPFGMAMSLTRTSGTLVVRESPAPRARRRRHHFRARVAQRRADEIARILVVVHDQDASGRRARRPSPRRTAIARREAAARATARAPSIGTRTVNVAPRSSPSLAATTVPPCISVRCRTSASPMPSPPCAREADEAPCRKRSNTCGSSSGADADAACRVTRSTASEPSARSDTSMRPPFGVNFTELVSRFHTTCCRRSGSPEIGPTLRVEIERDGQLLRFRRRLHRFHRRAHHVREIHAPHARAADGR